MNANATTAAAILATVEFILASVPAHLLASPVLHDMTRLVGTARDMGGNPAQCATLLCWLAFATARSSMGVAA